MQAPRSSIDELRRSALTRTVAVLAVASQVGCYRTWTEPIAPPPLTDSLTLTLERNHVVTVLQPRMDDASAVDSVTVNLGQRRTVTLLRPDLEGQWAVWGWTRDRSLRARTLVTSAGVETLPGPDSVRVRVPLVMRHRKLEGGKTALLVTGFALTAAVGYYVVALIVFHTLFDGIG